MKPHPWQLYYPSDAAAPALGLRVPAFVLQVFLFSILLPCTHFSAPVFAAVTTSWSCTHNRAGTGWPVLLVYSQGGGRVKTGSADRGSQAGVHVSAGTHSSSRSNSSRCGTWHCSLAAAAQPSAVGCTHCWCAQRDKAGCCCGALVVESVVAASLGAAVVPPLLLVVCGRTHL